MIKANAYGHGASVVADSLKSSQQIHAWGVATFCEAMSLRNTVKKTPIIVFSDCAPWGEELHQLCLQAHLTPVMSEITSLNSFLKINARLKKMGRKMLGFHLEFNTGMNRLGLKLSEVSSLTQTPESIFTHLAESENAKSKLTQVQLKNFAEIVKWGAARFENTHYHFANSGAIWNAKQLLLPKLLQEKITLARPGLSLYGVRPFETASTDGLKRAMTFTARVMNLIHLKKGDRVGYGGTYECNSLKGERVAIVGAGYADGVFRSLSNRGMVTHQSHNLKILGRVSMDLTAIQAHSKLKIADQVEFWGERIDPYQQADAAGTNPYEIMTRIGAMMQNRIEFIYE